jgi:hypothetical protein
MEDYAKNPPEDMFLLLANKQGETSFTYPLYIINKEECDNGGYQYFYTYTYPDGTMLEVCYEVDFVENKAVRVNDEEEFIIISVIV